MKFFIYLSCTIAVLFSSITAEKLPEQNQTIHIAVLDLTGSGVSKDELTGLTNRLRMELYKTGSYTIIERSLMDEILNEQGFQQTGCTDSECAVQLGQMLNVDKIIAGSIDRVGEIYATSIRMIDVESGKIDRIASDDCINCTVGNVLIQSMSNVAIELTTEKETQQQKNIDFNPTVESKEQLEMISFSSATPELLERYLHNSIQYYAGAVRPWRFKGRRIRSFNRVIRRLEMHNPHSNSIVHRNKRITTGVVLTSFVVTAPVGIPMMIINKQKRSTAINSYNEIVAQQHRINASTVMKVN